MGEKLGKIAKENEMPAQQQPYPPQPVGVPPQYQQPPYPYPPQQAYPYAYPQQPMPAIQGDLFKMEKITQDKKDFIMLEIIVEEKFVRGFKLGKIMVIQ
jgi:hypothetical protein